MSVEENFTEILMAGFAILSGIFTGMWKLFSKSKKIDENEKSIIDNNDLIKKEITSINEKIKSIEESKIKDLETDIKSIKESLHDVEKNITATITLQYEKIMDKEASQNEVISAKYDELMRMMITLKNQSN